MEEQDQRTVLDDAPGLARIAAIAWLHTAEWTVRAPARLGGRVTRALGGESPGQLIEETGADLRDFARRLIRIVEPGDAGTAGERRDDTAAPSAGDTGAANLRERGAELLRQSADVSYEEDFHPAYARILEVLAPDEARILRLLAKKGAQPSVDVRSGLPFVTAGSQLVAPGLTMIGAEAGCRHPDRLHAYLNNLYRLGLIWFSREPVREPTRYQVLEAQPEVTEALERAGRFARTIRRSIHLTPFGSDFCQTCLPLDTIEFEAVADVEPEPPEPTAAPAGDRLPGEPKPD
jgi:Abortive infection alpha